MHSSPWKIGASKQTTFRSFWGKSQDFSGAFWTVSFREDIFLFNLRYPKIPWFPSTSRKDTFGMPNRHGNTHIFGDFYRLCHELVILTGSLIVPPCHLREGMTIKIPKPLSTSQRYPQKSYPYDAGRPASSMFSSRCAALYRSTATIALQRSTSCTLDFQPMAPVQKDESMSSLPKKWGPPPPGGFFWCLTGWQVVVDNCCTDSKNRPTKIWVFPKIGVHTPKSSILIGFSIINHPFWGVKSPYFWFNTHIDVVLRRELGRSFSTEISGSQGNVERSTEGSLAPFFPPFSSLVSDWHHEAPNPWKIKVWAT